jgi:hypothetical protein
MALYNFHHHSPVVLKGIFIFGKRVIIQNLQIDVTPETGARGGSLLFKRIASEIQSMSEKLHANRSIGA